MGEILSFEELQKHKYINMECYHPPTSHLPRDLIVLYCMTLNLSYPVRMEGGQGRALAYRATYRALARSQIKAISLYPIDTCRCPSCLQHVTLHALREWRHLPCALAHGKSRVLYMAKCLPCATYDKSPTVYNGRQRGLLPWVVF